MKPHTLTVTDADNVEALNQRAEYPVEERWRWDVCRFCPVARAMCRQFPDHEWLVNRDGARPAGAMSYWFSFGHKLRAAMQQFDTHETHIVGAFIVFTSKL